MRRVELAGWMDGWCGCGYSCTLIYMTAPLSQRDCVNILSVICGAYGGPQNNTPVGGQTYNRGSGATQGRLQFGGVDLVPPRQRVRAIKS